MIRTLIVFSLALIACQSQVSNTNKNPEPSKPEKISAIQINEKQLDWIDEFPMNIKEIRDKFYAYDVGSFNCSIIDQFYSNFGTKLNSTKLTPIDSMMNNNLFGNYESDYGTLSSGYLYSIERPFMNFYPITVINYFGVVDRPVLLVLFNSNGQLVTSIEVANSYGEGGGCLSSSFVNDSTLLRNYEWNEYEIDSLGNDHFEYDSSSELLIIKTNGTYLIQK